MKIANGFLIRLFQKGVRGLYRMVLTVLPYCDVAFCMFWRNLHVFPGPKQIMQFLHVYLEFVFVASSGVHP